jgi:hypothetical protein
MSVGEINYTIDKFMCANCNGGPISSLWVQGLSSPEKETLSNTDTNPQPSKNLSLRLKKIHENQTSSAVVIKNAVVDIVGWLK